MYIIYIRSPSTSQSPRFKPQISKRQIKIRKGEFGLSAVYKLLGQVDSVIHHAFLFMLTLLMSQSGLVHDGAKSGPSPTKADLGGMTSICVKFKDLDNSEQPLKKFNTSLKASH